MIGYVTLGTNDLVRSAAFYDALIKELGYGRLAEGETWILWGAEGKAGLSAVKPFDGKPATVGNGVMVGFLVASPADVDRVHARALALGATDEGAPGPRGTGFYAAYFRDPDGNKLNAHVYT